MRTPKLECAPRLSAYVRREVLERAKEYAYPAKRRTAESTASAFADAMRGTNTGWWRGLIYTADVLDVFNRYRSEVRDCILDFMAETDCAVAQAVNQGPDAFTFAELIAATGRRQTWEDYTSDNARRGREAQAAAFAICFAVEYVTGELARHYAPEL